MDGQLIEAPLGRRFSAAPFTVMSATELPAFLGIATIEVDERGKLRLVDKLNRFFLQSLFGRRQSFTEMAI